MIGPARASNPDSPITVTTNQAARTVTLPTAPPRQAIVGGSWSTKVGRQKSWPTFMTDDRFLSADTVGRQYRPIFVDRVSSAVFAVMDLRVDVYF